MKTSILVLFTLAITSCAHTNQLDKNKLLVKNFYETALNDKSPRKAVELYVGDYYRQHNPYAGDGKEAFISYFESVAQKFPEAHMEIKRSIAEGDLVMVHVHSKRSKNERGNAIVDIFRIENDKIVEHWDVVQPIPEKSANDNTMF